MHDYLEPVAITGLGVLASNGIGKREYWDALSAGRSGIRYVTRFDPEEFECQVAGELQGFDPSDYMRRAEVRRWHSHVHQSVAVAQMAYDDAEFADAGYDSGRIATAFGTSVGAPDEHYLQYRETYENRGWRKMSKFASSATSAHAATAHVSARFRFRGPATTIGTGCSTGLDVINWGAHQIASGHADAAIVGATESPVTTLNFAAASALGILATGYEEPSESMRPFDRDSAGLVLAEGAACIFLERAASARARGAPILGVFEGYGCASEGQNPIVVDKEGNALSRAIALALGEAGLETLDIDAIYAHGVGLEMYDRCETSGYKKAFGDRAYRIPISATKSMTGQTYAAGGMMNVAGALMTINEGVAAPTINLRHPLPDCDLDYVPLTSRRNEVDHVLVTTLSFGGTHGAAIVGRGN